MSYPLCSVRLSRLHLPVPRRLFSVISIPTKGDTSSLKGPHQQNVPPPTVALPDRLAKLYSVFGTSAGQFRQKSLG